MTVPATPRRAGPYAGDGGTTAFGFSFKTFDETDVRVVVLDVPTSVETDAVLNSDYTVTLNPDQESNPGGSVNFFAAPANTKKVTLIGDLDFEQPVDLPDGGAYRAQQVEDALDRLSILVQQLKEITDRCAQVAVSSEDSSALFESINTLAANIVVLQTIVTNIADLLTLANDIADVNALAAISAEIEALAAIAGPLVIVASIESEVVTVAGISNEVQTVAANMASIITAVANLPALAGKANSGAIGSSLLTMATARILGRSTAGTGAVQELTAAQARTLIGADDASNLASGDVAQARLATALNASGAAPLAALRAWVSFNGTGTVAIRAAVNVSSITDNGTGDYTVNFTTAMPDANYGFAMATNIIGGTGYPVPGVTAGVAPTASAFRFVCGFQNAGATTTADPTYASALFPR